MMPCRLPDTSVPTYQNTLRHVPRVNCAQGKRDDNVVFCGCSQSLQTTTAFPEILTCSKSVELVLLETVGDADLANSVRLLWYPKDC